MNFFDVRDVFFSAGSDGETGSALFQYRPFRSLRSFPVVTEDENGSTEPTKADESTGGFRRIKDAYRMVAELRDGDGVDPKQERRNRQRSRVESKNDHSVERLAAQVERCANSNLGLGILTDFVVRRVSHGKGNHFLIELVCADSKLFYDPLEAQQAAIALLPRLRSELAREIHRKKVPSLSIRIVATAGSRTECSENSFLE